MAAVAKLIAARTRIADQAQWTTEVYARDAAGNSVPPNAADACRWCAYGALVVEGGEEHGPEASLLTRAARSLRSYGVLGTNDELGHAAVIAMYDHAIELAALCAEGC
ncbi:DUF6197 family protein [Methylobacterium fujisawaense]|uniref:DUF6197 family protein n=1 Tax=Methylobacterium fujisawaense TaxID=107400 RepID=UPI003CEB042E